MIRPLVHQAKVALQFAVVGGEEHIGALVPLSFGDAPKHTATGLIDEFVLDMHHRINLADLVVRHLGRE